MLFLSFEKKTFIYFPKEDERSLGARNGESYRFVANDANRGVAKSENGTPRGRQEKYEN